MLAMQPHPTFSQALIEQFAGERTRAVRRPARRRFARRARCERPSSDRLAMV